MQTVSKSFKKNIRGRGGRPSQRAKAKKFTEILVNDLIGRQKASISMTTPKQLCKCLHWCHVIISHIFVK